MRLPTLCSILALMLGGARAAAAQDRAAVFWTHLGPGVNLSSWFTTGAPPSGWTTRFSDQDLELLHAAGIRWVRVPVDPMPWIDDSLGDPRFRSLESQVARLDSAGFAVLVDLHPAGADISRVVADTALRARYAAFLTRFAAALPPDSVIGLELLNEPVLPSGVPTAQWNSVLTEFWRAARRGSAHLPLVLSGADRSSLNGLRALKPVPDPNVAYSIHYYEPFLFTHQGATWGMSVWRWSCGLHLDGADPSADTLLARAPEETRGLVRSALSAYRNSPWTVEQLANRLDIAAGWASRYDARIVVTEFGVRRECAPAADRVKWLRAVRRGLDQRRIAWAVWDDDRGFAITVRGVPDSAAFDALGLRIPR